MTKRDLESIRVDFPLLSSPQGKRLIYLDSACMSLRPQQVIHAIGHYYTDLSACAGRSNHRLARQVTEAVEKARRQIATFIKAKEPEEIVFTRNTSEGINLVAASLGFKAGEVVVTSDKEHNSNLVPWLKLQQEVGIEHVVVPSKEDNTFDMEAFERVLESKPVKLVSMVYTSNLDGVTFPMEAIITKAHRTGALVLIDGAQYVPHQQIDVKRLEVDFLAFSGHKMCGPSGMGVLYGKRKLLEQLDGFLVGGDTVEYTTYTNYALLPIPEKFEAGLQDYAGIIGLGEAAAYVAGVGFEKIQAHTLELNKIMTEGLLQLDRVMILGPQEPEARGGIVSFAMEGVDPHQISLLLDESYGILVRSGQHCVHSWFNDKGMRGSVRASTYFYNTQEEAHRLVEAMTQIVAIV
jgi:cysteine desulfurase / selenocysteine lyase